MSLLDTAHEVVHDNVARVSSLHLAIHVLQHCSDKLNDSNDEAAQSNGPQVVPATQHADAM